MRDFAETTAQVPCQNAPQAFCRGRSVGHIALQLQLQTSTNQLTTNNRQLATFSLAGVGTLWEWGAIPSVVKSQRPTQPATHNLLPIHRPFAADAPTRYRSSLAPLAASKRQNPSILFTVGRTDRSSFRFAYPQEGGSIARPSAKKQTGRLAANHGHDVLVAC